MRKKPVITLLMQLPQVPGLKTLHSAPVSPPVGIDGVVVGAGVGAGRHCRPLHGVPGVVVGSPVGTGPVKVGRVVTVGSAQTGSVEPGGQVSTGATGTGRGGVGVEGAAAALTANVP